jgi:ATP-dependent DNA ligase
MRQWDVGTTGNITGGINGSEGIVSKKLDAQFRHSPSKNWTKVKNQKAPVAMRTIMMGISDSDSRDATLENRAVSQP